MAEDLAKKTKSKFSKRRRRQPTESDLLKLTGSAREKLNASVTDSDLYYQLWQAAKFEVERMRGNTPAKGPAAWPAGKRILRLFDEPGSPTTVSVEEVDPNKKLETAIRNVNVGWRTGMDWKILDKYMDVIEGSNHGIDTRTKLIGKCTVANVRHLLGYWRHLEGAYALADGNWQEAQGDPVLEWIASYSRFNMRSLIKCKFEEAIEDMTKLWNNHYAQQEQEQLDQYMELVELSNDDLLTVNPILTIPRQLILAAAFKGSPPIDGKQYWPSEEAFEEFESGRENSEHNGELKNEAKWVEAWYKKAESICTDGRISLDLSHAFAGFYFTLLYLDSQDSATREDMRRNAEGAFHKMVELSKQRQTYSPAIARYAYSVFYGIFELVTGDPEKALKHFREAAQYLATSRNRFAIIDCLCRCCHAVAAQRVEQRSESEQRVKRNLKPEADFYLKEAKKVADKLKCVFYHDLHIAARSEVSKMRGETGRAERLDARSRVGQAGKRILRVFRKGFKKHD